MTTTDLAGRALEASRVSLGRKEVDWPCEYEEGLSEEKRRVDLSAALVARDFREVAMGDPMMDNKGRVRTEGGLLYASSRPFAGLLGWVGRVS